jgi:hypothetical protein
LFSETKRVDWRVPHALTVANTSKHLIGLLAGGSMDPVTTRWRALLADKMGNISVYRSGVDFAIRWSERVFVASGERHSCEKAQKAQKEQTG